LNSQKILKFYLISKYSYKTIPMYVFGCNYIYKVTNNCVYIFYKRKLGMTNELQTRREKNSERRRVCVDMQRKCEKKRNADVKWWESSMKAVRRRIWYLIWVRDTYVQRMIIVLTQQLSIISSMIVPKFLFDTYTIIRSR
jgi:hypothetical protein